MNRIPFCFPVTLACVLGISGENALRAAPKSSQDNVKFTVKADKQVVTLTLEIAKGWHAYANPVGNADLLTAQTVVTFIDGDGKPVAARIEYPDPIVVKDNIVGDYNIYEGTVTIKATLATPIAGPLEAVVGFQTVTSTHVVLPSRVKLKVN